MHTTQKLETGSRWLHSQTSREYEIVTVAMLESTTELHVVYRCAAGVDWTRPLREWEERIAWGFGSNMRRAPRFVRVDPRSAT